MVTFGDIFRAFLGIFECFFLFLSCLRRDELARKHHHLTSGYELANQDDEDTLNAELLEELGDEEEEEDEVLQITTTSARSNQPLA